MRALRLVLPPPPPAQGVPPKPAPPPKLDSSVLPILPPVLSPVSQSVTYCQPSLYVPAEPRASQYAARAADVFASAPTIFERVIGRIK